MAAGPGASSGSRFWRVLLILLAVESGFFLMLVPWSAVWGESLPLGLSVSAQALLRNHYLRGAVSGLGLINLWVGFVEALALLRAGNSLAAPRR